MSANDNLDTEGLAGEIAKLEQEAIKAALEAFPQGMAGNPAPIVMAARMQTLEGVVCSIIAQFESGAGDGLDLNIRTLRELRDYWKNIPPAVARVVEEAKEAMRKSPDIVRATSLPPMRPKR